MKWWAVCVLLNFSFNCYSWEQYKRWAVEFYWRRQQKDKINTGINRNTQFCIVLVLWFLIQNYKKRKKLPSALNHSQYYFLFLAMSGVPQLNVEDITESSATLIWTHPSVQYETYYITFTSLVSSQHFSHYNACLLYIKESWSSPSCKIEWKLWMDTVAGLGA